MSGTAVKGAGSSRRAGDVATDVVNLLSAEHRARRTTIVRALALSLAQETAQELAGRTRSPLVTVHQFHAIDRAARGEQFKVAADWVVRGEPVELAVTVKYADYAYVTIPGEPGRRTYEPDVPIVFIARQDGRVQVDAFNALSAPTRAFSKPLRVMQVPSFDMRTLAPANVRGLSTDGVASLAESLLAARLDALELDPWDMSRAAQNLSPSMQLAGQEMINSLGELLAAVQNVVIQRGQFEAFLDQKRRSVAQRVRETPRPPSPADLFRRGAAGGQGTTR